MRALAVALVALAFLPVVAAEHVFSHRFVVEGRLVGADGVPIHGELVELNVTNERLSEPCGSGHRPVTDPNGDFSFCFHRHDLSPNAVVRVSAGNASASRVIDVELRRMVFLMQDFGRNGTVGTPFDWGKRFRLDGRVWDRGATMLEGVWVGGLAVPDEPVNVTLLRPGGGGNTFDLRTDGYGDYRATFDLLDEEFPEDVRVRVHVMGATREVPLDTTFHRMTLDFRFPLEEERPIEFPGTTSGPVTVQLVLVVVGSVGVAWWLAARKKVD